MHLELSLVRDDLEDHAVGPMTKVARFTGENFASTRRLTPNAVATAPAVSASSG